MSNLLTNLIAVKQVGYAEPSAFGLAAYQWVSVAMLILIAVFVWKGVPKLITTSLDAKIQAIKDQLEEAQSLRRDAESLRDEYAAKIANAEKASQEMLEAAKREANALVKQAESDGKTMVARRKRMAEDKIAAAERDAVEEVKKTIVAAATSAASDLISKNEDVAADKRLTDNLISKL